MFFLLYTSTTLSAQYSNAILEARYFTVDSFAVLNKISKVTVSYTISDEPQNSYHYSITYTGEGKAKNIFFGLLDSNNVLVKITHGNHTIHTETSGTALAFYLKSENDKADIWPDYYPLVKDVRNACSFIICNEYKMNSDSSVTALTSVNNKRVSLKTYETYESASFFRPRRSITDREFYKPGSNNYKLLRTETDSAGNVSSEIYDWLPGDAVPDLILSFNAQGQLSSRKKYYRSAKSANSFDEAKWEIKYNALGLIESETYSANSIFQSIKNYEYDFFK